jgi:hypothetical protein
MQGRPKGGKHASMGSFVTWPIPHPATDGKGNRQSRGSRATVNRGVQSNRQSRGPG